MLAEASGRNEERALGDGSGPASSPAMPATPGSERRVSRSRLGWTEVLLVLPCLVPLFLNLGLTSMWKSEGRWISIASSMLETGNWLDPRLHGSFYGDKPLLSYWAIALLASALGRLDEQVARLPSAISGAATVLLTAWMAARLLGKKQAVLSAWILATAYSFFFWSRAASADMLSLMFGTGAVAVYLEWTFGFRPWQPILFFTLLAMGGQSKGMPGVILPVAIAIGNSVLAPLARGLCARRGWREIFRDLLPASRQGLLRRSGWIAAGLALGAGLYLLPFVVSRFARGDWQLLGSMYRENFVRALSGFDHTAPVLYYLYTLPLMFLPWGPWLAGALGWAGKRIREDSGLFFPLTAFVVVFSAFTASESRRSYYILPIFPFAAILVAGFWTDISRRMDSGSYPGKPWRILALLPCAVFESLLTLAFLFALTGGLLPGPPGKLWRTLPHPMALAAMAAVGLTGIVLSRRRAGTTGRFFAIAAAGVLVCFWLSTDLEILREKTLVERDFAEEVKARIGGSGFLYFRTRDPTLLYYLGPGPRAQSPEEVLKSLTGAQAELFVVSKGEDLGDLTGFERFETTEVLRFGRGEGLYFLLRCRLKATASQDGANRTPGLGS
jgi:4-amino-4-deoxy-L-arabinose transferase-like glycosyltransferase